MTRPRLPIPVVAAILALSVAACGSDARPTTPALVDPPPRTMEKIKSAGAIKIGVKYDQPGLGFKAPNAGAPEGFDVEIGQLIAAKLGIAESNIQWVETLAKNRETFLRNGTVDIVAATYSITDGRRLVVGQAGPYYVTGQQLLVRKDSESISGPETLKGKQVCSAKGSTSIETLERDYGAVASPEDSYTQCVKQLLAGKIDAVTTDGAILLGYAAQNAGALEVVGDTFSEERYGIGYPKGDTEFCQFLDTTLNESFKDGSWRRAFDATLGKSGSKPPVPPTTDPCL